MNYAERSIYISPDDMENMVMAGSRKFGKSIEPGAGDYEESPSVKATRKAIFETLEGIFGQDELVGERTVPARLGQRHGIIEVISTYTHARAFKILTHIEGESSIEILSINRARALNKNLGRMDTDELNRISKLVDEVKTALKPPQTQP